MDVPVSEQSRDMAARMIRSKQQVPHYYLTVDMEVWLCSTPLAHALGPAPRHALCLLPR